MAVTSEAREALAEAVKELMRTAESVPNVDGWEPQTALMMGALYAIDAITLAEPELVIRALGGRGPFDPDVAYDGLPLNTWTFPVPCDYEKAE